MAQYPFDQKFRDVVDNLPGYGERIDSWDMLVNHEGPGSLLFEALAEAGYSNATVSSYINTLKEMPAAKLIELALVDKLENTPAILVLQQSKERDVLEAVLKLTLSDVALERELAALVLMREPGMTYKDEAVAAVKAMIAKEKDDSASGAMAYAVHHLKIYDCSEFLAHVAQSTNASTRYAAAYALGGRLDDDLAVKTLIALSQDLDDDVRDWATFGLHNGLEQKPFIRDDIREALFANIDDAHEMTCYEALEGLAICKDPRVLEPLIAALELDDFWNSALYGAIAFGHPALYPALVKLNERIPGDELIEEALLACTPIAAE